MSTSFKITTKAPSKCILSGEHSCVYGHPMITMALSQYTTAEGRFWKEGQNGMVSLLLKINGEEISLEHTKSEFEQSMKPLLMTPLKVEDILLAIEQYFPERAVNYAVAFAFALKFFWKYTSFFSIGKFVDELTSFKGEITVKADVPQEAGMGSSASFFSAIILNIYVLNN